MLSRRERNLMEHQMNLWMQQIAPDARLTGMEAAYPA